MLQLQQERPRSATSWLRLFDESAKRLPSFPGVIRIAHPIEAPLCWLASQEADSKIIWQGRGEATVLMGCGTAARVSRGLDESYSNVIARCRQMLGDCSARFFGGFAFDTHREWGDEWDEFGPGKLWWPRILYDGHTWEVAVLNAADLDRARHEWEQCEPTGRVRDFSLPTWTDREYLPDRERWSEIVEDCRQLIDAEVLEKVVMVRRCDLRFPAAMDALSLFGELRQRMHSSYLFYFQPRAGTAFMGASPERLFRRQQDLIRSEVLAGTRPRGVDARIDSELGQQLINSEKDQLEHAIVRKSIRQRMRCCAAELQVDPEARLCKLPSAQHLYSGIVGRLRPGIDDGTLLERLHPTPALGGYPTENALAEIQRLEPFSRGWYGAPIGWIGRDAAEFAVGIRSALVQHQRVRLYAGAGLVRGSTAEGEWLEIDQKIRDYLQLLTAAPRGLVPT